MFHLFRKGVENWVLTFYSSHKIFQLLLGAEISPYTTHTNNDFLSCLYYKTRFNGLRLSSQQLFVQTI